MNTSQRMLSGSQLAVVSWQLAVVSWQLASFSWQLAVGSRQLADRSIKISRRILSGLGLVCVLSSALLAEDSNSRADEALESGSHSLWYDSSKRKLVFPSPVALQASEDDLKDRHRVIYDSPPPSASSSGWWDWFSALGHFLSGCVRWIFMILIALLIVCLAVYLRMAIERGWYVPNRRNRRDTDEDTERDQAKIVDLPFNIESPRRGLLGQAEAFRLAGDYSRAIIYLFSHVLVELDEADCIRLQRGKTNRVYLRELKDEPRLAELHRYLMLVFEAVFFGRYVVNREQCDRCWNLLESIDRAAEEAKQRRVTSAEPDASIPNLLGLILLLGIAGCDRNPPLPTDAYGDSSYSVSHKSISGLSVFRALCEEHGLRTFELKSLSPRTQKLDTILWAPKDFRVPSEKEVNWFDDWLSGDVPRTLIFVGRDYSPASNYWHQAAVAATPADRRTFRLRQAYVDTEMETARSQVDPEMVCDWFLQRLDPVVVARRVGTFRGPWSKDLDADETNVVLRGSLKPNTEYGDPTIQTLLKSDEEAPIISSISYKSWGRGRLILVANGSVLMNESLAMNGNQKLAERFVAECVPKGRIGFLSNVRETWIRDPWDEQEPKGFELLRVWPLSLISIQGLFLGFIALLAMLPIFGRPQRLPAPSTTDFGKHIEALGDLLSRSRDRNYALHRIADYFRDVRRDAASSWSTVAPPAHGPTSSEPLPSTPTNIRSSAPSESPSVHPDPTATSISNSSNQSS